MESPVFDPTQEFDFGPDFSKAIDAFTMTVNALGPEGDMNTPEFQAQQAAMWDQYHDWVDKHPSNLPPANLAAMLRMSKVWYEADVAVWLREDVQSKWARAVIDAAVYADNSDITGLNPETGSIEPMKEVLFGRVVDHLGEDVAVDLYNDVLDGN